MIKEQRAVFLCVLTLLVYALTIFFEKGFFAFPFPLNESVLFVMSMAFFNWNSGESKRFVFLFGFAIFFRLLSQVFIWSFILSEQNFDLFEKTFVFDLFYGIYLILLIYFSLSFFKAKKKKIIVLSKGLVIVLLLISFIVPEIEFFALTLITIVSFYLKRNEPVHFLIILFFILELFKVITYLSN